MTDTDSAPRLPPGGMPPWGLIAHLRDPRFGVERTLALLVLVAMLFLNWGVSLFDPLRDRVFDVYQQLTPRDRQARLPVPITVLDIDEDSLDRVGQWPWPRATIATIVERLGELGARVVAFDVVFAEPGRLGPQKIVEALRIEDRELIRALGRLPQGDLILSLAMADVPVVLARLGTASATPYQPLPDGTGRIVLQGPAGTEPAQVLRTRFPGAVASLEMLEDAAAGIGSVALLPDVDGIVRRVPLVTFLGEELHPSLTLEVLRLLEGGPIVARAGAGRGIADVRIGSPRTGRLIVTDSESRVSPHFGRFTGDGDSRYVPIADVVDGSVDPERIRDHIVFIGTSAAGLLDIKATPIETSVPGVDLHVQLLESIFTGALVVRPVFAIVFEALATILLGTFLIAVLPAVGARFGLILSVLAVLPIVAASWLFWVGFLVLFDPVFPALTLVLLYLILTTAAYVREEEQRRTIRRAFDSYVAPQLVRRLTDDPTLLRPGGEVRQMTFLFTDIAGFTSFTEQVRPNVLVETLNRYLDGMCRIAMEHEGTIDKIVGDAVHVMFNAPFGQDDHAERAVRCALAMDRFAAEFRAALNKDGVNFGETRLGVNSGDVVVGNFGGNQRFHYTAHGDPINTAARLESVNKHLGTRVCVSGYTAALCPADMVFRPVGVLYLKGKTKGVEAFEPVAPGSPEAATLDAWKKVYAALGEEDASAAEAVARLAVENPDDPVFALHARRIADGDGGIHIRLSEK